MEERVKERNRDGRRVELRHKSLFEVVVGVDGGASERKSAMEMGKRERGIPRHASYTRCPVPQRTPTQGKPPVVAASLLHCSHLTSTVVVVAAYFLVCSVIQPAQIRVSKLSAPHSLMRTCPTLSFSRHKYKCLSCLHPTHSRARVLLCHSTGRCKFLCCRFRYGKVRLAFSVAFSPSPRSRLAAILPNNCLLNPTFSAVEF
jgi:hypothetical protein